MPLPSPDPDLILANARLILGDEIIHGGLVVQDGKIADLFTGRDRLRGRLPVPRSGGIAHRQS